MLQALTQIQLSFRLFYRAPAESGFGMEIEFKVTAEGYLSVKQARPWAGSGGQPQSEHGDDQ